MPADKELLKIGGKVLGALAAGAIVIVTATRLILPPAPQHGVTFQFDPVPNIAGYRIYYGNRTNALTNMVDIGLSTTGVLWGFQHPFLSEVRSYNSNGVESLPSNLAGFLSVGIIANIYAQTNGDLSSSNWADAFPVRSMTNPTDTVFYRLRIEQIPILKSFP